VNPVLLAEAESFLDGILANLSCKDEWLHVIAQGKTPASKKAPRLTCKLHFPEKMTIFASYPHAPPDNSK
jgi:hypothetical protein